MRLYLTLSDAAERPQYYEIHKYRAVLGISLTFMAIDLLGGIFSLLSLVFKRQFDVLAAVAYSLFVVRSVHPPPSLDERVSIHGTCADKCLKISFFFPVLLTNACFFFFFLALFLCARGHVSFRIGHGRPRACVGCDPKPARRKRRPAWGTAAAR